MKKSTLIFVVLLMVFVFAGVANAEVLLEENTRLKYEYDMLKKNPFEGVLFSFIVPGGGYYYAGNYDMALKYGAIELATLLGTVMLNDYNDIFTLSYLAVKAFNMYGSYKEVEAYNQRLLEQLSFKLEKDKVSLSFSYNF